MASPMPTLSPNSAYSTGLLTPAAAAISSTDTSGPWARMASIAASTRRVRCAARASADRGGRPGPRVGDDVGITRSLRAVPWWPETRTARGARAHHADQPDGHRPLPGAGLVPHPQPGRRRRGSTVGRRGGGMARRWGVAAPPGAHRHRPAAVSHRELRALPRGPPRAPHHRVACSTSPAPCSASRRCSTRRRSTTSSPAAPATRRTRTRRPTASSTPMCRAWWRWTMPSWATAASRSSRRAIESCSPPTRRAASAPTSPTRSTGHPWRCAPARRLWFHSRTPHRSGPNLGSTPRRALYPTYNARREGDLRAAYYEQKSAELGGRLGAVSLIGDFQGRTV